MVEGGTAINEIDKGRERRYFKVSRHERTVRKW